MAHLSPVRKKRNRGKNECTSMKMNREWAVMPTTNQLLVTSSSVRINNLSILVGDEKLKLRTYYMLVLLEK